MILGLIPARGGSKRLPRKNIQPLGGKPLIAWTIDAARKSKLLDVTVLSSDDPEILTTAVGYGCAVHQRSPALATDTASSEDVARDVLPRYPDCSYVVLLQPTSPLRTSEDIDKCIRAFRRQPVPGYFSVCNEIKPNGAIYIVRSGHLRAGGTFLPKDAAIYIMPPERSVDIDTVEDLREAERLLRP